MLVHAFGLAGSNEFLHHEFDLAIINEHQQILLIASIFSFFFLVFMTKIVAGSFFFFVFRYSIIGEVSLLFVFADRFSLFVFQHSNSGRISNFDIRNPILTFEPGPNI